MEPREEAEPPLVTGEVSLLPLSLPLLPELLFPLPELGVCEGACEDEDEVDDCAALFTGVALLLEDELLPLLLPLLLLGLQ